MADTSLSIGIGLLGSSAAESVSHGRVVDSTGRKAVRKFKALAFQEKQELSYRKQIARQLHKH